MKPLTLILLFLLVCSFCCTAQSGWTNYNKDNSPLQDDMVTTIAIDHDQILWAAYGGGRGIGKGVVKFDGTTWVQYTASNSGLPNNDIRDIKIDQQGDIWFACYYAGIVKFDGNTWTRYTTSNSGMAGNDVHDIEFDSNGNMWLGNYFSGVSKFDGASWIVYTKSNAPFTDSNCISDLTIDKGDNVWVGMDCSGGMAKFSSSSETWTSYHPSNSAIPDHTVLRIQADASGIIWASHISAATSGFDGTSWTVYEELKYANKFAVDNRGGLWAGGYGLFKFGEGRWDKVMVPEIADTSFLTPNFTLALATGTSGNVWMSNYSGLWINRLNTPPVFEVPATAVDQDFEIFKVKVVPVPVPESEKWQKVSYSLVNPDEQLVGASIDSSTGEITLASVAGAFGTASLRIIANDGQAENNIHEELMTISIHQTEEVITSSVGEVNEVQFFPNPVSTTLFFTIDRSSSLPGIVVIDDMMGREVKRAILMPNKFDLDVADLAPGVYLIKITQNNTSGVKKLVKSSR